MPVIDTNSETFHYFSVVFALLLILFGWKFALESILD